MAILTKKQKSYKYKKNEKKSKKKVRKIEKMKGGIKPSYSSGGPSQIKPGSSQIKYGKTQIKPGYHYPLQTPKFNLPPNLKYGSPPSLHSPLKNFATVLKNQNIINLNTVKNPKKYESNKLQNIKFPGQSSINLTKVVNPSPSYYSSSKGQKHIKNQTLYQLPTNYNRWEANPAYHMPNYKNSNENVYGYPVVSSTTEYVDISPNKKHSPKQTKRLENVESQIGIILGKK